MDREEQKLYNTKEIEMLKVDNKRMLNALKLAHLKHTRGDDSIGWDQLSEILCNELCNVMGNEEYCRFLEAHEEIENDHTRSIKELGLEL